MTEIFRPDGRPILVAIAGPNGAGKTTFFHAHLRLAGLPFINADELARELGLDPYDAAEAARLLRRELLRRREGFIFETVFSDPAGEKLGFLEEAVAAGHNVLLCYIGVEGPKTCAERVAMRVTQGGHDVPAEKLRQRYARGLSNLASAMTRLPRVLVFDHQDLRRPFRLVAVCQDGARAWTAPGPPKWLPETPPHPGRERGA